MAGGNIDRARAIRLGLKPGSLDRKILAWAIAMSGKKGIPSAEISKISADLASWPGQWTMLKNSEAALAREDLSAKKVIQAFGNQKPASTTGAILLARAHLASGNKNAARTVITPIWHYQKLSKETEKEILTKLAGVS